MGAGRGAIRVADLSYRYPDGTLALAGISLSVGEGEKIALVGPNGAGKSTLLLHLNGILPERPDDSGQDGAHRGVWITGTKIEPATLSLVRQQVGFLFQDPDDQLFCPTVLEDVAFCPLQQGYSAEESRAIALGALAAVGLSPELGARPPQRLSFGEKRRVCLAGVLAAKPSILALDEPTSNLDPRARRQFLRTLKELRQTVILATHDLEMVLELCPRVLLLDQGRAMAEGAAEELLWNSDLLERHGLESPKRLR